MPVECLDDEDTRPKFYRLLVLGHPRAGKTTMCISTAPGRVLAVAFESKSSFIGAQKALKSQGRSLDVLPIEIPPTDIGARDNMLRGIIEVRQLVERGDYDTVVFDSVSIFGNALEREVCKKSVHIKDGVLNSYTAYAEIKRHSQHIFAQMEILANYAHVITTMHWGINDEPIISGQAKKNAEGAVPYWPGGYRMRIAEHFPDVVWMGIHGPTDVKEGKVGAECLEPPYNGRVFCTGTRGGYGAACRSWAGNYVVPADVTKLFERFDAENDPTAIPTPGRDPVRAKPAAVVKPATPTTNGTSKQNIPPRKPQNVPPRKSA